MKNGHFKKIDKNSEKPSFLRHRAFLSFIITFVCCTAVLGVAVAAIIYYKAPSLRPSYGSTVPSSALSSNVPYSASNAFTMLIGVYSDSDGAPQQLKQEQAEVVGFGEEIAGAQVGLQVFQHVLANGNLDAIH